MPRTQADSARRPTYVIVPYNGKIADITHADVAKHTLDLAVALGESRKIIGGWFGPERMGGTGTFGIYPNEGGVANFESAFHENAPCTIIADGTQRLEYKLSVANDDFDLFCFGYIVEL